MKRIIFAILLIGTVFFTACGKKNDSSDATTTDAGNETAECSYTINNVNIVPGTDFADTLKALGEPLDYSEAASCYFDGMDKSYVYEGYTILTYPSGDRDFIQDINITSDSLKTDKGITVGSTLEDMTSAYGEDYKNIGSTYKYYFDDKTYVYFFFQNDAVKNFGYAIEASN